MKKIIVIGVIALFIVVGIQPAFANNIIQETENKEKLQFWWIFVHIQEIYGTLDDPQFRPLANVTVEVDSSAFGIFWRPFWSGRTDKNGEADVPIIDSLLYKVMVSKEGFHTYKCLPFVVIISGDYFYYDVYFTMAEDGSPFNETKSSAGNTLNNEDCDCQEVSRSDFLDIKDLLTELKDFTNGVITRFGHIPEVEVISNDISDIIDSYNPLSDTPIICSILENMSGRILSRIAYIEALRKELEERGTFIGYIIATYLLIPQYLLMSRYSGIYFAGWAFFDCWEGPIDSSITPYEIQQIISN